jgi:hypothetical protein
MPEFHPTAPSVILRTKQPLPPPCTTILVKHSGGEDREEENLDSTEFVEDPTDRDQFDPSWLRQCLDPSYRDRGATTLRGKPSRFDRRPPIGSDRPARP